jgi:hypothetical protein
VDDKVWEILVGLGFLGTRESNTETTLRAQVSSELKNVLEMSLGV